MRLALRKRLAEGERFLETLHLVGATFTGGCVDLGVLGSPAGAGACTASLVTSGPGTCSCFHWSIAIKENI